jgi:hypothetical protein
MMSNISRETFKEMDIDSKLMVIYDCLVENGGRMEKLEKRKWWNTSAGALSGFFGGAFVIMAKIILWK